MMDRQSSSPCLRACLAISGSQAPDWLRVNQAALTQALVAYRDANGIAPHPAVLVLGTGGDNLRADTPGLPHKFDVINA